MGLIFIIKLKGYNIKWFIIPLFIIQFFIKRILQRVKKKCIGLITISSMRTID